MSDRPKTTVFYDGTCPMCTALIGAVEGSSQKERFDMRDMHTAKLPTFLTKEALDKEMYVIGDDGAVHKNAGAILEILKSYPRLRLLARVGNLPVVRPILSLGYSFVAANRKFLFGPAARVYWLKAVTVVAFAIGFAISAPLWLTSRLYPLVPVLSWLPAVGHPLDYVLYASLFFFAAAALIVSKPQKFIWALVGVVVLLCLGDWTRWQPWVFQYTFLLVVLALFSWKGDDAPGYMRVLNVARLVVASTYVYSGLQKMNAAFIGRVFPWMVQPITDMLPQAAFLLYPFGVVAPFIQVAFGIGLLTKRFRRVSVAVAVAMHLFIFAMLGPWGLNWNSIVWPWTLTVAIFDIILFAGRTDFSLRDIFWRKESVLQKVTLALFVILPFFSFFNLWDSYLSSALYSGNVTNAHLSFRADEVALLPREVQQHLTNNLLGSKRLDISTWAFSELNVPPYPESRVFRGILASICSSLVDRTSAILVVEEHRLFNSSPQSIYTCPDE